MNCHEFEENLALHIYDELPAEQQASLEAHAAQCAACKTALEKTRRLHAVLAQRPRREPTPEFVAHCRIALDEVLDREQMGWQTLFRGWFVPWRLRPSSGFALALTLTIFGFGLGWTLRPHAGMTPSTPQTSNQASTVDNNPNLQDMRINSISRVAPDPKTGEVRITMDAAHRVTLEGSLDDPNVQQVLLYAMKSYDNPGIRRDTLDALRQGGNKPTVRQALLYSMQHDPNAGMRLEALEAVRNLDWGADMEQSFLDVLEHDKNDGVRVQAIDVLAGHADAKVVPALQRLASNDACPYVRLKSVKAIQTLGR